MVLSIKQAAERLGVTDSRVRQLIIAGKLPAIHLSERVIVIEESAIDNYERPALGRPKKQHDDTP